MHGRVLLRPWTAAILGMAIFAAPAHADHPPMEGELTGVHADYFDSGSSDTRWRLDTGDDTVRVLPTELPALSPGKTAVKVAGREQDGAVVGSVSPASLQATPTLGGRKLAVIVFNFSTDTSQPWTAAQVRQRVFTDPDSTSAFFREESHDQLWLAGKAGNLDGDVYGYYTLSSSNVYCDFGGWAAAADSAAAADGFDPNDYQHVMYVFPGQPACPWAGVAFLPGHQSWINGDLTVRVTGHELGHNLGLHHAGSWDCTSGGAAVTLSPTCTVNEYNDPFDNMGAYGSRHSHGWHLQKLGVLEASNVQTVSASGTYSMTSALDATAAPTTLRIPRTRDSGGNVVDWYYLEIRERGGVFDYFSLTDPVLGGVSIRVNDNPSSTTQSKLLDTHPSTGGIGDAALAPGETFSDGQVSITTVSAGSGDATVEITVASQPADTQAPSAPNGLHHSYPAGDGVRLAWNPSSDNTGVTAYSVFRDGVQVAGTGLTYFDDTTAPAGPHVYTVYAHDSASNRSASSAPYTVVAGEGEDSATGGPRPDTSEADRRGPEIKLRRRRTASGRLLLVARATDPGGVERLALYVNGRRVRSVRGARVSHRWRGPAGRFRVLVKAVDASGNRASLEVRLRMRP